MAEQGAQVRARAAGGTRPRRASRSVAARALTRRAGHILEQWVGRLGPAASGNEELRALGSRYLAALGPFVARAQARELDEFLREVAARHGAQGMGLADVSTALLAMRDAIGSVLGGSREDDPWEEAVAYSLRTYAAALEAELREEQQRHAAALARREEDRVLAAVAEKSVDAIVLLDRGGVVRAWNRGAEELFGYSRREVVGRRVKELAAAIVDEEELARLRTAAEKHGYIRDAEIEGRSRDGRKLLLSVTATLLGEADAPAGFSVILRDLTAQKALHRRLAHSEKLAALGTMAAGLAHEIGNPLASILSLVQLIERQTAEDETRRRLSLVREQITRIARIVRDLGDYTRGDRAGRGLVDVNEAVQAALTLARYGNAERRVHVSSELGRELEPVNAGRDHLLQVFLNLLLNAYDAVADGGNIRVRTAAAAGNVLVEVADDGPGVPQALLSRLGEPFLTTKEPGRGTGLGLFVSYGIVRELGGDIQVESPPGRGAKFTVTLPGAGGGG